MRREEPIAGRIVKEAVVILIQSVIIVGLALLVGASFPGRVAVPLVVAALLGAAFGAPSNGFALIMRQEEALIGAVRDVRDARLPRLPAVRVAAARAAAGSHTPAVALPPLTIAASRPRA